MSDVKVIPQYDYVLIEPMEAPAEAKSSLIITPDSNKPRAHWGKVLAVGPDVLDVKVGMVVVFPLGASQPSHSIGKQRVVREGGILARLEGE